MGCGCGKKKVAKREAPGLRVRNNHNTGDSRRMTRLGLKTKYGLPLKLSKAIDGRDLLVVTDRTRVPRRGNTIIFEGHNALVRPEQKAQLVARWPHVFEDI